MRVCILSFTPNGHALSARIAEVFASEQVVRYGKAQGLTPYTSLHHVAEREMHASDVLIFIGAAGIAVRAVAPYVRRKDLDPAVLVVDERGSFVISLLSGHIGGANAYARMLAQALDAQPVITTATDVNGVWAADVWAVEHECAIPCVAEIRAVSAALLRGETVGLQSDFALFGELPEGVVLDAPARIGILLAADADRQPYAHTLHLVPRIAVLGVGCRRGTAPAALHAFALEVLRRAGVHPCAVRCVCSIDCKSDEPAVLRLATDLRCSARFYSARQLNDVSGTFPASDFVRRTVGTDNVCQRAAALAAEGGRCVVPKTAHDGMTVSIYLKEWRAFF